MKANIKNDFRKISLLLVAETSVEKWKWSLMGLSLFHVFSFALCNVYIVLMQLIKNERQCFIDRGIQTSFTVIIFFVLT